MTRQKRIEAISLVSAFSALALVFSLLESFLPPIHAAVPFAKIGLANIITLLSLEILGFKKTFCVVLIRILLGSLFLGNVFMIVYSLPAGLVAFFVSWIFLKSAGKFLGLVGVSVIAAIFHNAMQLLIACLMNQNFYLFLSAPYFVLISIAAGMIIGLMAGSVLKGVKRSLYEV